MKCHVVESKAGVVKFGDMLYGVCCGGGSQDEVIELAAFIAKACNSYEGHVEALCQIADLNPHRDEAGLKANAFATEALKEKEA